MIFAFKLVFIVNALPTLHFPRTDDERNPLFSGEEQSSGGFGSSLPDSHQFNSGTDLHNSQDFPDLFASASTSTDASRSLFHDFEQKAGADRVSSGNNNIFGDLGLASDPDDFSLADHTLAFNDPGWDRTNQVASPDLFMEDHPGESSSASSFSSSALLTPDDKALSNDVNIPDSVSPGEGALLGDHAALNPANPVDVSSAPEDDFWLDHEDSPADISLVGGGSTTDPVNLVEDTSSSVPDNAKGTLIASAANKISTEGSTVPPTCSGQKTPACCLSAKAETGVTLPGYKSGCISCMYFSGFSNPCI